MPTRDAKPSRPAALSDDAALADFVPVDIPSPEEDAASSAKDA